MYIILSDTNFFWWGESPVYFSLPDQIIAQLLRKNIEKCVCVCFLKLNTLSKKYFTKVFKISKLKKKYLKKRTDFHISKGNQIFILIFFFFKELVQGLLVVVMFREMHLIEYLCFSLSNQQYCIYLYHQKLQWILSYHYYLKVFTHVSFYIFPNFYRCTLHFHAFSSAAVVKKMVHYFYNTDTATWCCQCKGDNSGARKFINR